MMVRHCTVAIYMAGNSTERVEVTHIEANSEREAGDIAYTTFRNLAAAASHDLRMMVVDVEHITEILPR